MTKEQLASQFSDKEELRAAFLAGYEACKKKVLEMVTQKSRFNGLLIFNLYPDPETELLKQFYEVVREYEGRCS